MSKLKCEWYAPNSQDRMAVKELVVSSKPSFELLKGILLRRVQSLRKERLRESNYESPSYPYVMAECNATERCLLEIIDLLTIEE